VSGESVTSELLLECAQHVFDPDRAFELLGD